MALFAEPVATRNNVLASTSRARLASSLNLISHTKSN